MPSKEEYFDKMAQMVIDEEDEEIADLCKAYLAEGYDPEEAIFKGLIKGMNEVGKLFEEEEYYISDLLICSDAMYNGIDVLTEKMESHKEKTLATAVIGVVEGDTHDIGKNLVKLMLETAGLKMIDLGKDVPCEKFIDEALANDAKFIMMSTLMTTTMENMKKVIDMLKERGLRDKFIVMIGGGPVSESFAQKIGADAYITKPFSVGILKVTIKNILANRELLRQVYNSIENKEKHLPVNCTNTLDWKFIASVKECIEKNMGDLDFGVDVLSNQHHMSRTSFYNKLKALTGYAPADYIRMIRLQRAAQLLKQKEYTITEIAEIVGFSDAKYFREVFKKYYNVSPSKFVNSDQE